MFNSSFHTESIFFCIQLFLLAFLTIPSRKIFYNLIIGLTLGFLFLQKTIAIFYIFPILLYIILSLKKNFLKSIMIISSSFMIILILVGYGNYKRMGKFYIMPTQGGEAIYHYLTSPILSKSETILKENVSKKILTDRQKWLAKNNINLEKETDRLKFIEYKKDYTIKLILNNPLISAKHIVWKSIQTGILNPLYVYHYHDYEQNIRDPFYLKKKYMNKWIPISIGYSLIIYLIIVSGFFYSLRKIEPKFNLLLSFSAIYMFLIPGWVGNSRYFVPCLIYLSIYFGYGLLFLLNKYNKTSK